MSRFPAFTESEPNTRGQRSAIRGQFLKALCAKASGIESAVSFVAHASGLRTQSGGLCHFPGTSIKLGEVRNGQETITTTITPRPEQYPPPIPAFTESEPHPHPIPAFTESQPTPASIP